MFRIEVLEIGARHDEGAPALRHLLAVYREKAVTVDRVRSAEAGAVQHGRPEKRVKVGDVFADEVKDLGITAGLPVGIEVYPLGPVTEVSEARHVADGGVQPDVEELAGPVRDLETEVRGVPGDVPVFQPRLEPLFELVGNSRLNPLAPVCAAVPAGHPVTQKTLEVAQLDEVMLGLPLHGGGS